MPPRLLIASPQMRDPHFESTVVLLCHHDEQGALGLVLNRPTTLKVSDVLRQLDARTKRSAPMQVLWGGPVEEGAGFVIWSGALEQHHGWSLPAGLAVSTSREALVTAVESSQHFHLCLGYAGWAPSQLDQEIAMGSWLYADIDKELCLTLPIEQRYRTALSRLGLTPETVWMSPIDE